MFKTVNLWLSACLLISVFFVSTFAQDDPAKPDSEDKSATESPDSDDSETKPEDKSEPEPKLNRTQRLAKLDSPKLLPQTGLWGDDGAKLTPDKFTFETVKIEADGCEKMEGYIALPENLDPDKKYPVFFMFHGNGDVGKNRVKSQARITTERDPVITIGVQYQELLENGKGKMGLPRLASSADIYKGSRWLLDKVIKEQPVDTERVFVGGFSWGTSWASGWARAEWQNNPDSFPFRAVMLFSSGGAVSQETCPPCPWILFVGEKETAVKGTINVVRSVRHFGNTLRMWGFPVMYHEIPGMGHTVNNRCKQITRDIVNVLGGPGVQDYPVDDDSQQLDKLAFKETDDGYAREVIALCEADDWAGALARVEEIKKDKEIKRKLKGPVKSTGKEIEKIAKKVLKSVHKLIQTAIKDEKMPNPLLIRRLQGIVDCWPESSWIAKKKYGETLEFLQSAFAPVERENERAQMMIDAAKLEQAKETRSDAKALFEKLAKRADEDEGKSVWPKAAKYRLMWWADSKK